MLTFKTIADLAKLSRSDPAYIVVRERLYLLLDTFPAYDPDTHGYVVLVQPGDTRIDLHELKCTMADLCFDGVTKRDGHYLAVYLTNNSFALEFVVPDAEWLPTDIRDNPETYAEGWVPCVKAPPF